MTPATPQSLTSLTITRPDDWHLHVRDGGALNTVVPHAAAQFGRALIMPNLRPPVTTVAAADAYRQRILAALRTAEEGRVGEFLQGLVLVFAGAAAVFVDRHVETGPESAKND